MKKIMLIVAVVVIAAAVFFYFRNFRNIKNARTYYEAEAEINSTPLAQIKTKLEKVGCVLLKNESAKVGVCSYKEEFVTKLNEKGFVVYPKGMGFGPIYFYITENKILNYKDIPGMPNKEKFKEAVRNEIGSLGNIAQIKENTWKFNKIKYPWVAVY